MLAGLAAAGLVAASFVTPKLLEDGRSPVVARQPASHGAAGEAVELEAGVGLPVGSDVPSFAEEDVVTGEPISATSLPGKRTLLFFSEGIMCQACFEQIQGLERVGDELARRGISLVSVTPDPPKILRQAIGQFGITTPVISDEDRDMSAAFNTLGKGMHPDTPGHAFVLVENGRVRWQRDYWLEPYRTMYVDPTELLADIPT